MAGLIIVLLGVICGRAAAQSTPQPLPPVKEPPQAAFGPSIIFPPESIANTANLTPAVAPHEVTARSAQQLFAGPPMPSAEPFDTRTALVHPASKAAEFVDPAIPCDVRCQATWNWQPLPDSLIYRSYLAGFKEPRIHSLWAQDEDEGSIWDIALGGRVGLVRYGTRDKAMPDGWQLDLEGAAFPRLDLEEDRDLVAVDFRAGFPITFGAGPYRSKLAYYHLSSHLGDEFQLRNPGATRYNYTREVIVLGQTFYLHPDWRVYAEAGWAFHSDVSGEWEFQFGVDYSPIAAAGFRGMPFAAVNGHLREEVDFSGNLVAQLGWQWRQAASGHLFRVGAEYFNGKSDQFEFFNRFENKVGLACWYDY